MEEKLKEAIALNKFCNDRLKNVQDMLSPYKTGTNTTTENTVELTETNNERTIEIIDKKCDNDLF